MVLHRLGSTEQAREYYQQLAAELDAMPAPHSRHVILRTEAAELLGIEDTPDE
jgi:hypothetical protein